MTLDALKALLAKATAGPWERAKPRGWSTKDWGHDPSKDILGAPLLNPRHPEWGGATVVSSSGYDADGVEAEDADIDLIVAAVNALPVLIAVAEAAQDYLWAEDGVAMLPNDSEHYYEDLLGRRGMANTMAEALRIALATLDKDACK